MIQSGRPFCYAVWDGGLACQGGFWRSGSLLGEGDLTSLEDGLSGESGLWEMGRRVPPPECVKLYEAASKSIGQRQKV